MAIGIPTFLERPTTTALRPNVSILNLEKNSLLVLIYVIGNILLSFCLFAVLSSIITKTPVLRDSDSHTDGL